MALEPLRVNKPKWECFPGAVGAIEYYSLISNGKAMENGSINKLGQAYAKKFNIKFKDEKGKEEYAWQVCTGNGARLLAGVILIHGDDKGLILPPKIAPIQVVITTVFNKENKEKVVKKAKEVLKSLTESGINTHLDDREITIGRKFYDWEIKGVPLRVELGLKEIENKQLTLTNRLTFEKKIIKESDISKEAKIILEKIQDKLYENSKQLNKNIIVEVSNAKDISESMQNKKVAKVNWCSSEKCWIKIKEISEGIELFGTDLKQVKGKCVICKENSDEIGYIANTY